jgi:hypothetical protein
LLVGLEHLISPPVLLVGFGALEFTPCFVSGSGAL